VNKAIEANTAIHTLDARIAIRRTAGASFVYALPALPHEVARSNTPRATILPRLVAWFNLPRKLNRQVHPITVPAIVLHLGVEAQEVPEDLPVRRDVGDRNSVRNTPTLPKSAPTPRIVTHS
jgi:hypothetical protein